MSFSNEKKSVLYQTLTFAVSFLIKIAFNAYIVLLFINHDLNGSETVTEIAWCFMAMIWTGLPISFSFFKNYQSFRKPDHLGDQKHKDGGNQAFNINTE